MLLPRSMGLLRPGFGASPSLVSVLGGRFGFFFTPAAVCGELVLVVFWTRPSALLEVRFFLASAILWEELFTKDSVDAFLVSRE